MRILLILIVIIAVLVVVQARRHHCKYDATLINCVLGKSGGKLRLRQRAALRRQLRRPKLRPPL